MDFQEVKALLRIYGTDEDAYIKAVLPLVLEAVRDYTGETFLDADGKDLFPGTVKMAVAKWVQAYTNPAAVTSQGMGSVSQSFDGGGIPAEVKALLDAYNKKSGGSFGFVPMPGRRPSIGVPDWSRFNDY